MNDLPYHGSSNDTPGGKDLAVLVLLAVQVEVVVFVVFVVQHSYVLILLKCVSQETGNMSRKLALGPWRGL